MKEIHQYSFSIFHVWRCEALIRSFWNHGPWQISAENLMLTFDKMDVWIRLLHLSAYRLFCDFYFCIFVVRLAVSFKWFASKSDFSTECNRIHILRINYIKMGAFKLLKHPLCVVHQTLLKQLNIMDKMIWKYHLRETISFVCKRKFILLTKLTVSNIIATYIYLDGMISHWWQAKQTMKFAGGLLSQKACKSLGCLCRLSTRSKWICVKSFRHFHFLPLSKCHFSWNVFEE